MSTPHHQSRSVPDPEMFETPPVRSALHGRTVEKRLVLNLTLLVQRLFSGQTRCPHCGEVLDLQRVAEQMDRRGDLPKLWSPL